MVVAAAAEREEQDSPSYAAYETPTNLLSRGASCARGRKERRGGGGGNRRRSRMTGKKAGGDWVGVVGLVVVCGWLVTGGTYIFQMYIEGGGGCVGVVGLLVVCRWLVAGAACEERYMFI